MDNPDASHLKNVDPAKTAETLPLAARAQDTRNTRTKREFARFVAFGTVNTFSSYLIYLLLLLLVSYPIAYTLSFACGIFLSYCLNAYFVFGEKLRLSRALQYPLVYLVQYLVGLALLYLLVEVAQISKLAAPFVVVVLTVPITYKLSRYIIKRTPQGTGAQRAVQNHDATSVE